MIRAAYTMFILFSFCTNSLLAQSTEPLSVVFTSIYANQPLTLNTKYPYQDSTITITTLRFYISAIELLQDKKPVWQESNSYHLIDLYDSASMRLLLNIPKGIEYDSIKFHLGIDSLTNTSGAHGGDLDPTKGMYWSWQSGYINFKLEGTSPLCPARKHEFQFHLGGYAAPFASLQTIYLPLTNKQPANVSIDIQKLLSVINVSVQYSMMIPGDDAIALSRVAAASFSISK